MELPTTTFAWRPVALSGENKMVNSLYLLTYPEIGKNDGMFSLSHRLGSSERATTRLRN